MTSLSTFQFQESHPVRVQLINNEPWFCLRDVCCVLDLNARSSKAFGLDEKGSQKLCTPSKGGDQSIVFVNEPNLYRVIFRSNKPEARQFQDWVFNVVLPTIRKTGSYTAPKPVERRDYVTNSDMLNIKRLIYSLTRGLYAKTSVCAAIWFALRHVTGVPSPAKFEVQHLPIIAHELKRIYAVLHGYSQATRVAEQVLMKRIIRGREDMLDVLCKDVQDSVAEHNAEVFESWDRLFINEFHNLVRRSPNDFDHAEFSERKLI